jgi:hypothetical protein
MRAHAKPLFDAAFERHPEILSTEDVNLFLDLLLVLDEHQQALEICCRWKDHCCMMPVKRDWSIAESRKIVGFYAFGEKINAIWC